MSVESRFVTVANEQGLHMRPAKVFAETAARFQSEIEVVKEDMRIDAKSVLSVLTLGAAKGTQLELNATGPDAAEAVDALATLMESVFPAEDTASSQSAGGPDS